VFQQLLQPFSQAAGDLKEVPKASSACEKALKAVDRAVDRVDFFIFLCKQMVK